MSIKDAMTEDVARTTWCPFATVLWKDHDTGGAIAVNRWAASSDGQPDGCNCIASACGAWRWSEEKRTQAYLQAVVEHMKATGDNFNKATQEVVKRREEFSHTEGFCGLAGQP